MSFNYLEVERAVGLISAALGGHAEPTTVERVELIEFPAGPKGLEPVSDLSVGLRLSNRRTLALCLRAPWVAVLYGPSGLWRASKRPWTASGLPDTHGLLTGRTLESIRSTPGDREVTLSFSGGATLVAQLFPARANWVVWAGTGVEAVSWREPAANASRPGPPPKVELREFEGRGGDWLERAYEHYKTARVAALAASLKQGATGRIQAKLAQLIRTRGQMMDSLREAKTADGVLAQAEAVKAVLHEFPKGRRADSAGGVRLDPALSVAENAARMFERYKKLQRTRREVEARMQGIEEQSKDLTSRLAKLRAFDGGLDALVALLESLGMPAPGDGKEPRKRADRAWEKQSLRSFVSKEGLSIWIGRNHRENEELVIRLARGNDLWMHLKGKPGAHAIVRLPKGRSASLETLLDGAALVAYHSGMRAGEKAEVDYTFRKNVKRVPGGGDVFLVTYTQNKTLAVKLEDERLCRLLKQQ